MNLSLFIAKRYLVSKKSNNAINIINRIASMGIIIGALALFVVLSVFSGLKEFSLSFTNAMDPDLKLNSTLGKSILITPEQEHQIKQIDGLVSYSKIIEERVLFTFDGKQEVTYLKGIDSLFSKVNHIEKNLFNGQWLAPNTNQVVVGYGIAQQFSMGLLDFNRPLEVFVPKPGKGARATAPGLAHATDNSEINSSEPLPSTSAQSAGICACAARAACRSA